MVERKRWALGRMVLGGHHQVVLVRPAGAVLVVQVLHYPEQIRSCPTTTQPAPAGEEMRLAGMLIDAAGGTIDWNSYRDGSREASPALSRNHP